MADVIQLGIQIGVTGAQQGASEIQKITDGAQALGQEADGASAQLGKLSQTQQAAGQTAQELAQHLSDTGQASQQMAQQALLDGQAVAKRLAALRVEYDLLGKTRAESEQYLVQVNGGSAQAQREAQAIGQKIDAYHRLEQTTKELAAAQDIASARADKFLESLKHQADTAGMTRKELLSYQAAQLGVSAQATSQIEGIKESGHHMDGFRLQTAGAKRELIVLTHEFSQGNYSRFGGSMMVLGEQTGAAGLLFSGAGLAALGLTASLGLMGYEALKGAMEQTEFNNALIMTGSYAGVTGDGLNALAHQATQAGGSLSEAKKVVAELAASGKYTGDQIGLITEAVIAVEHATGGTEKSTEKLIQQFESLAVQSGSNVQGSHAISDATLKLDDEYHFLTEAVFQQILALEKEDSQKAASKLATEAFAQATKERAEEITANLGNVASAWNLVKKVIGQAGDALGDWGKKATAASEVARLTAKVAQLQPSPDDASGAVTPYAAGTRGALALAAAQAELTQAQDKLNSANAEALKKGEAAQAQSKASHAAALIKAEDAKL